MIQSKNLRIQFSDKVEAVSCTTENSCHKSSSTEFRSDRDSTVKARTGSDAIQHWAHDTMTLERLSKSEILSIRLLSRLSKEQPEPGASSSRFERSSLLPRPSRQCRCRQKPSDANVRRSCRVKETSRAKSVWPEENDKITIVLSSNHQFKIPKHILKKKRRCHEQGIAQQSECPIE